MRGNRNGENKFENFLENERQLRGELAFLYMPGVFVLLVYLVMPYYCYFNTITQVTKVPSETPFHLQNFFSVAISPSLSSRGTTFKTPERNKGSTT